MVSLSRAKGDAVRRLIGHRYEGLLLPISKSSSGGSTPRNLIPIRIVDGYLLSIREKAMRKSLSVAAIAAMSLASVCSATAQQQPANPNPPTPAVVTPNTPSPSGAPAEGANSFHRRSSKVASGIWRLFECERSCKGRPGCLARQGNEGRPIRRCKHRLSRQHQPTLSEQFKEFSND